MKNFVLRQNASPVYDFLSFIHHSPESAFPDGGKKVLDCGAGGMLPPLVLFYQNGFECSGIDVSGDSVNKARSFCLENNLDINFSEADMRRIPFSDDEFDFVYEHYSMCHLTKADTRKAVSEMMRVVKPGGLVFLGVMSDETRPMEGREISPGEWLQEEGGRKTLHSVFSDDEADDLVSGWNVLKKEKKVQWPDAASSYAHQYYILKKTQAV